MVPGGGEAQAKGGRALSRWPKTKHTRVSRACNECRVKRIRCDGTRPKCSPCTSSNRRCEWDSRPRKRGLTPGYVRSIESLLGFMMHSYEGSRELALAFFRGDDDLTAVPGAGSCTDTDYFVHVWRQSAVFLHVDSFPDSAPPRTDSNLVEPNTQYNARLATLQVCSPERDSTAGPPAFLPPATTTTTDDGSLHTKEDINQRQSPHGVIGGSSNHHTVHRRWSMPVNWMALVEVYFSSTQRFLPLFEKSDIIESATIILGEEICGKNRHVYPGERALVMAVLALASYHEAFSSTSPSDVASGMSLTTSSRLRKEATAIVMNHCMDHHLSNVRALVVLSLLEMSRGCLDVAWTLITQAVMAMVTLNLIPSTHVLQHCPLPRSKRNLICGVFVVETMVALRIGRRSYLRSQDLHHSDLLVTEVASLQPDSDDAKTTFSHFVRICLIINDFIHAPGYRRNNEQKVLQDLQTWFTALSPGTVSSPLPENLPCNLGTTPEYLNLSACSTSLMLMLQLRIMILRGSPCNISRQLFAANSSLLSILGRIQEAGFTYLYPFIDTYMFFLSEELLNWDPVESGDLQLLQAVVDSLNGLAGSWVSLRSAQQAREEYVKDTHEFDQSQDSGPNLQTSNSADTSDLEYLMPRHAAHESCVRSNFEKDL